MLVLRGREEAMLRVSSAQMRRALLLLTSLLSALTKRGHVVTLAPAQPGGRWSLDVEVDGEQARLSSMERMTRRDHVLTDEERAREKRYGSSWASRYDYTPSARFTLTLSAAYGTGRKWSDGKKQRLEGLLGDIVITIEGVAPRLRAAKAEAAERQRQWKLEERRRQGDRIRSAYERALGEDLQEMAERWRRASGVREFVAAVRRELQEDLTDEMAAWLGWADTYARSLDPLSNLAHVAKAIEPDIENMSDEQAAHWLRQR